jgi:hypothetical protein
VVVVTFTPASAVSYSGQIVITSTSTSSTAVTQTVEVTGAGAVPFTLSPTSLSLGNVFVGCSVSQTFTVTPGSALDFVLETSLSALAVNPLTFSGSSPQTVSVRFTPATAGAVTGSINVRASQGGREVGRNSLTVTGTGTDLVATPATLDFGSVRVGTNSPPLTVRLSRNPAATGSLQATVTSSNPVFTVSNVSAAGEAQVVFAPTSAGPFTATLTFTAPDPVSAGCSATRTVTVRGTGITVDVSLNPISADFGSVLVGANSEPRPVALNNNSSIGFNGTASSNSAAFTVNPTSFSVAPGASQTFTVEFRPRTAGPLSGNITFALISSGTPNEVRASVTLTVSGQGRGPADLTLSPDRVDFGDVGVGSSVVRTVTVANPGGTQADVTASTSAPFSLSLDSFTLAAGGSRGVNVQFQPTTAGSFQGTATFRIGELVRTLALNGRGVTPNITFTYGAGSANTPIAPGGTIMLPATRVGSTAAVHFQVTNGGSVSATFSSIRSGDSRFAITGLPSLPFPLTPGGSLTFVITFRPEAPGRVASTLTLDGRSFNLEAVGTVAGATITGIGRVVSPAQQPTVGVRLSQSYPTAVRGQLRLAFTPNALGGDDPTIQFATGGRSVDFVVPANSTTAMFGDAAEMAFQSGTVAGVIDFEASLSVDGVDVSPTPSPTGAVTIDRAAPVIRSVAATRTPGGIQAVIVAFATTREVSTVDFQFTPAQGANLGTTRLSADITSLMANWYGSPEAAPFGSLFSLTVPFTVQGEGSAIRSLSVTLSNGNGTSAAMEAALSP